MRRKKNKSNQQTRQLVCKSAIKLSHDDNQEIWVTLTRTGTFTDARYGTFDITQDMYSSMISNFENRVFGQDIVIDLNHNEHGAAAADIKELRVEGDRLRALVLFTKDGIEAVKQKRMKYVSAEYHENFKDNETGIEYGPTLIGAALTIRPIIKNLDAIALSDKSIPPHFYFHERFFKQTKESDQMKDKYLKLLAAYMSKKSVALADTSVKKLSETFSSALGDKPSEDVANAKLKQFEGIADTISLAEKNNGGTPAPINITLAEQGGDALNTAIETVLAKRADDIKILADGADANVKKLSEIINADAGISDTMKKELCESGGALVNAHSTDGDIKALAAMQLDHAKKLSVAEQLSALGMPVSGSVRIEVGESGELKTLAEHVDRRLALADMPDRKRYKMTGGTLQDSNKDFAGKVLANFDQKNYIALQGEAKKLAAGIGGVADIAMPISFERAVIREALYALKGLALVDAGQGVVEFAAVTQLPYSYRDTTAAGRQAVRKYEGQAIANAGVIQTTVEARPIPQKLSFLVTDEMRYLMNNGRMNWDTVTENRANASRIIAEDTDMLIHNELLDSADEFSPIAVVNETVAGLNGVLSVFPLANWPVVRPRFVFDLKGVQVGTTLNDIVVTLAAAAILEYDGTGTQANGNYYVLDYNLGEIHVVNQAGAIQAPAANALVISYSYVTNVARFDTDIPAGTLPRDFWDTFLPVFAGRKDVIQDQRFYNCDFSAMSGTSKTNIEQALTFSGIYQKPGTSLESDGDLGRIKDVPTFRTAAPGILMGDQRIILGERGMTKLRIAKPWSMNQLLDQTDSAGSYLGQKHSYGDQFIILKTPEPLQRACTSIAFYSVAGRVAR